MSTKPVAKPRRVWWWLVLMLLVVAPFLPEIAIYAVTGLAKIKGCDVTDKAECMIGKVRLSEIIAINLRAGVWVAEWMGDYGIAAVWLTLCYLAITFGWRNLVGRLLLGLAVTVVFAVLPYFGALLSISHLVNPNCQPNEGGVGPCVMFGGDVGDVAHNTVNPQLAMAGFLIALVAFVAYAIIAIVLRLFSALGWIKSPRGP
jgi:hypothetical protein